MLSINGAPAENSAKHAEAPLEGLGSYLRTFREFIGGRMYLVFALMLVEALLEGVGIVMLLPLLQTLDSGSAAPGRFAAWITEGLTGLGIQGAVPVLCLVAVVFLVKGAIAFAASGYGGFLRAQLQKSLHSKLYDAYSRMSYRYYTSRDTGYFFNLFGQDDAGLRGRFIPCRRHPVIGPGTGGVAGLTVGVKALLVATVLVVFCACDGVYSI